MSTGSLVTFLYGAVSLAAIVAGLFFLRFWRASGDRLFLFLVSGFWLLAADWAALALMPDASENRVTIYLVRFLAFVLIIVGVIDKNRRAA